MATKVFLSYVGGLATGQAEKMCQKVADALSICCDDVVFMPGVTLTVVDVPDALTAKRAKAGADEEKSAKVAEADKAAGEAAATVTETTSTRSHKSKW